MITDEKLDQIVQAKKNACFTGKAGVGKTAMVEAAFTRAYGEGNYTVLNGATLDPFLDLLGLPYAKGAKGKEELGFLRPELWGSHKRAIFVDEYNRAHKATRNAVMELTQFGTVNGQAVDIDCVWIAVNPAGIIDETGRQVYDVERMDPAQLDRFHFHLEVPNELNNDYFKSKYGDEVTRIAVEYFNNIEEIQRDKFGLTPRRMDYALDLYLQGFDLRDIISPFLKPEVLAKNLASVSLISTFRKFVSDMDFDGLKKFVNGPSSDTLSKTLSDPSEIDIFMRYINMDRIPVLLEDIRFNKRYDDDLMTRCLTALEKKPTRAADWRNKAERMFWPLDYVKLAEEGVASPVWKKLGDSNLTEEEAYHAMRLHNEIRTKDTMMSVDAVLKTYMEGAANIFDRFNWIVDVDTDEPRLAIPETHPDFDEISKFFAASLTIRNTRSDWDTTFGKKVAKHKLYTTIINDSE